MDRSFTSRLADFQPEQRCFDPAEKFSTSTRNSEDRAYAHCALQKQRSVDGHGHRHPRPANPPDYKTGAYNFQPCNSFMDDEDFSFKQFLPFKDMFNEKQNNQSGTNRSGATSSRSSEPDPAPMFSELNLSFPEDFSIGSGLNSSPADHPNPNGSRWASNLLTECAKAISQKETSRMQQLLWMLNELSSPYGDCDQKLASYFLQALFCKVTDTGSSCYRTLCSAVEKTYSFDSARKMILKFQDSSPWTTFGHVAANGAILEALDGETKLHIIDMSSTFCTQWPTLLEALATRSDDTPHLRLTTVVVNGNELGSATTVMKEIGQRMEKFARLMGVPFEFNVLHLRDPHNFPLGTIDIRSDEALAINCIHSLQRLPVRARDSILSTFRSMNPKIVTVVEDEVDLTSRDFAVCFGECLRFFTLFFESLEESFSRTSNERLMLERTSARSLVNILACDQDESENYEAREKAEQWGSRLRNAGFGPSPFSDDVVDDVRALLKRYKEGWGQAGNSDSDHGGLFLTWKDQCAIWASAWKPANCL